MSGHLSLHRGLWSGPGRQTRLALRYIYRYINIYVYVGALPLLNFCHVVQQLFDLGHIFRDPFPALTVVVNRLVLFASTECLAPRAPLRVGGSL